MAGVAELIQAALTTPSPSGTWSAIADVGPSASLIKMVGRDPAIMPVSPATEQSKEVPAVCKEHSRSSHVAIQTLAHWPHLTTAGSWTV